MSLVLDSSATLARIFPEEHTPPILELFRHVARTSAWVPELWKIEVANALSIGLKKDRITTERRTQIFSRLMMLPISCDRETGDRCWDHTLQLAERHSLTVYDATYLELALRLSLPLATLDRDLRKSARAEGVDLLGL